MNYYGKIYAIKSNQTELIYIGSTIKELDIRFSEHKSDYKRYINGKTHFVSSFEILQYEDVYIELIEDYTCNNKTELKRREGIIIQEKLKQNICVNKYIAGRIHTEYLKEHREQKKEHYKEYREQHKEQIKEYKKQKFTCECGSIIGIDRRARHNKSIKHLEYIKLTN
jgi:hypothetical protein